MEIKQRTTGPVIEQASNFLEFNFENLTDASGAALSFSGYSARFEIIELYSDTVLADIRSAAGNITISADDISMSYDTSAIVGYTKGVYRYKLYLEGTDGKEYERVKGFIIKK